MNMVGEYARTFVGDLWNISRSKLQPNSAAFMLSTPFIASPIFVILDMVSGFCCQAGLKQEERCEVKTYRLMVLPRRSPIVTFACQHIPVKGCVC